MMSSRNILDPHLATDFGQSVVGMTMGNLSFLITSLGESPYRAAQIYDGLYRQRWTSWEQFSSLPKSLRFKLAASAALSWPKIYESLSSNDESVKHTLLLDDGSLIETVYMPYTDRITICLSSQVGCAMGCAFCATGLMGMKRNLSVAEIVGQVLVTLNAHNCARDLPINLVFMGMGEPLNNLDQIMAAFHILTDTNGLAISPKHINLSTSGLVNGIQRLGTYVKRPRLAVSLNATTDECRSMLMPVNRLWNMTDLMIALKQFPLGHKEYITIEYVLIKNITDRIEDGWRLAHFVKQFPSKVNLIPFNKCGNFDFESPSEARINKICSILTSEGVTTSVRRSRGKDVAGACGQMVRMYG